MRIIKFRAKCAKDSRYAGEWVEGGVLQCEKSNDVLIVSAITDTCSCTYHVDPETVGQFTGLYDRSGREIYEGDIIAGEIDMETINGDYEPVDYCEGVVTFENGKFIEDEYGTDLEFLMRQSNKPKVIGNIHDHPSLIEEGGETQQKI